MVKGLSDPYTKVVYHPCQNNESLAFSVPFFNAPDTPVF
jgi:hypothetical protein